MNEFAYTAAENSLLTEEVSFCLFTECGLKDTCTACADTACISKCDFLGVACVVLLNADQGRNTLSFGICLTYDMSRALRRDHDNVQILCRTDELEVNVEAMCECKRIAFLHMRCDELVVDISGALIRYEHHDDVACFRSAFDIHDLEVRMCFCELGSLFPVAASFTKSDNDVYAALCEVFRMCMSLRTEADNSYCLSVKNTEVAV